MGGVGRSVGPDMAAQEPTDTDLVARAQGGDAAALNELLRRHQQDVARIAFRIVGPGADLDDVVQEALIQIARSIGRFERKARFTTWLYRVVTNVAKMHRRAQRARPQLASEQAQAVPRSDALAAAPDELTAREHRMQRLYSLLHELPEKKRLVLLLHDFEGLSAAEIAEVVQAPVMTVRTRLFYARKALYAAIAVDPVLCEVELAPQSGRSSASTTPSREGRR